MTHEAVSEALAVNYTGNPQSFLYTQHQIKYCSSYLPASNNSFFPTNVITGFPDGLITK